MFQDPFVTTPDAGLCSRKDPHTETSIPAVISAAMRLQVLMDIVLSAELTAVIKVVHRDEQLKREVQAVTQLFPMSVAKVDQSDDEAPFAHELKPAVFKVGDGILFICLLSEYD